MPKVRNGTLVPWEALLEALGCDNNVAEVERRLGKRFSYSTLHNWYREGEIPERALDQLDEAGVPRGRLEALRRKRPEMTGEASSYVVQTVRSGPAERLAQGIVAIFDRLPEGFDRDVYVGKVLTYAAELAREVANNHNE